MGNTIRQVFRAIVTLVLGTLMVGFGVCGAFGLQAGFGTNLAFQGVRPMLFLLLCGAAGVAIAYGLGRVLLAIWRPRPAPPADE